MDGRYSSKTKHQRQARMWIQQEAKDHSESPEEQGNYSIKQANYYGKNFFIAIFHQRK